jgi:hypothetical protein
MNRLLCTLWRALPPPKSYDGYGRVVRHGNRVRHTQTPPAHLKEVEFWWDVKEEVKEEETEEEEISDPTPLWSYGQSQTKGPSFAGGVVLVTGAPRAYAPRCCSARA